MTLLEPLPDLEEIRALNPDGTELLGSRCDSCGSGFFPRRQLCFECGADALRDVELGHRGVLYSYSRVELSSARPTPYTLGYVDLDNGVRVLADISVPEDLLVPDLPVALTTDPAGKWSFAPAVNPAEETDEN
ncbi:Zn-ribbon domain-containing OB-fold protein [Nocardia sp. NBC_00416]|uniref:Zn-ribbon domain-containing OB-fold protein n=1 Tax=Nocardia sp. NBC_00416 TaxID=2975991 RepID=UPI002E1AE244